MLSRDLYAIIFLELLIFIYERGIIMNYCSKCGAQVEDGLSFCSSCGASMNGNGGGNAGGNYNAGEKKPFNVLALISMIAGILGLFWAFWGYLGIVGVILGIAAAIMGSIARKNDPNNGMAKAGLICGIIAIVIGAVAFIACIACIGCAACSGGLENSIYDSLY